MAARTPELRSASARRAAHARWNPADIAPARDYRAAALEDHVRRVVADAPPLTDEQRQRIAALLRGGAA